MLLILVIKVFLVFFCLTICHTFTQMHVLSRMFRKKSTQTCLFTYFALEISLPYWIEQPFVFKLEHANCITRPVYINFESGILIKLQLRIHIACWLAIVYYTSMFHTIYLVVLCSKIWVLICFLLSIAYVNMGPSVHKWRRYS